MNNFKKIGMTALAASLVSTSVFAGELTASGGASLTVEGYSGTEAQTDTAYSMGDSVILSGSTELDNGMTVTMAFELDGDAEATSSTSAYDDNSLTIASDSLGSLKFSAHGGSSASSAMDGTAAGDMYDNFDELVTGGAATKAAGGGENNMFYTLPSMVDGLTVNASLNTAGATGNNALGYSATYAGVEGLSVSFGVADIESGAATTSGDQTVMKASYAYGPVTVAYSNNEYDVSGTTSDQDTTSWNVSYTLTDSISVGYGVEEISTSTSTEVDAEYSGINASYTAGGLTVSAAMVDAENIDHSTDAVADGEYWKLGLAFAF